MTQQTDRSATRTVDAVERVLQRHGHDGTRLMHILREVQDDLGWLSPQTISAIAAGVGRPRAAVQSTAEFYSFFHVQPLGQYRILFSDNITDQMLGSHALRAQLCHRLGVASGQVSADQLASVDTTSCTGLCDQGPAALVNYRAIGRLDAQRIDAIADLVLARVPLDAWPAQLFEVEGRIRRSHVLLGADIAAGEPIAAALRMGPERVLEALAGARLRGRGGAGFGTDTKWRVCRAAPGFAHYVVGNADEGEPGTFKDRVLLSTHTDLILDGMVISGLVNGAQKGYVYLRGEYRFLYDRLVARLVERRRQGLLGANILGTGFAFDIEVCLGAGA